MSRESSSEFINKWSDTVASRGYTQIPNTLITCQKHLGLSDGELITFIQLISFRYYADSEVFPAISRLCIYGGKSFSTVQKRLNSLEAKGYIERYSRNGKTTIYDLESGASELELHSMRCTGKPSFTRLHNGKVHELPHAIVTTKEHELLIKQREEKTSNVFHSFGVNGSE